MTELHHVLDSALALAAQGISVFPCRLCRDACLKCSVCKTPATPHGFHDASADRDEVRRLWREHPGALIGAPTGITFDVLDIDLSRHEEARDWWRENRHRILPTRVHRTGGGGLHVLFQPHPLVRCSAGKICTGVDTRGSGGYIIHWPARGLPVLSDAAAAQWPDWLLAALAPKAPPPRSSSSIVVSHNLGWLRGLTRAVAAAAEGQRNSILFWASCRAGEAVRDGQAAENFVADVLLTAATHAGLSATEARRTIQSGMRRL